MKKPPDIYKTYKNSFSKIIKDAGNWIFNYKPVSENTTLH